MSLSDPIGDMIARIKNAQMRNHKQIELPSSNFKSKIAEILKSEGFIREFKVESILLELFRMRRGKIVKLADSIKLNSDIYKQLTIEENIFYKTIYDNSKEFENQVRGNADE